MSLTKFAGIVIGILLLSSSAAAVFGPPAALGAFVVAAGLSSLNALAAYALVLYARNRSNVVFMRAILGGMTVRMGAMLLAVVIAVKVAGVALVPFVASLLFHFAAFLALEILSVHRAASTPLEAGR